MIAESKPHWQPLSLLPVVALMIEEMLQNSEDQLKAFSEAKDKPHGMDGASVLYAIQKYKEQLEDARLYEEQLKRWQMQPLTGDQRREVDKLLDQLPRIKQLSKAILEVLDEIKEGAFDEVLGKSNLEIESESLLRDVGDEPETV